MNPEHELEPDEQNDLEIRRDNIAFSIAFELKRGTITTDNISKENGLSGLDSVCFYFANALDLAPEELRDLVLHHYKTYGENIPQGKPPVETDSAEKEIDNSATHNLENDEKATAKAIAMMIRMGLVADDAESLLNGRTPLEQLISYLYWSYEDEEIMAHKKEIIGEFWLLGGGYYLRSGNFGVDFKLIFRDDSPDSV